MIFELQKNLNFKCKLLVKKCRTSIVRDEDLTTPERSRAKYLVSLGILDTKYVGFQGDKLRFILKGDN